MNFSILFLIFSTFIIHNFAATLTGGTSVQRTTTVVPPMECNTTVCPPSKIVKLACGETQTVDR